MRNKFAFPPHVRFPNLKFPHGEREVTLEDLDYGILLPGYLLVEANVVQTRPSLGIKTLLGCVHKPRCRFGSKAVCFPSSSPALGCGWPTLLT